MAFLGPSSSSRYAPYGLPAHRSHNQTQFPLTGQSSSSPYASNPPRYSTAPYQNRRMWGPTPMDMDDEFPLFYSDSAPYLPVRVHSMYSDYNEPAYARPDSPVGAAQYVGMQPGPSVICAAPPACFISVPDPYAMGAERRSIQMSVIRNTGYPQQPNQPVQPGYTRVRQYFGSSYGAYVTYTVPSAYVTSYEVGIPHASTEAPIPNLPVMSSSEVEAVLRDGGSFPDTANFDDVPPQPPQNITHEGAVEPTNNNAPDFGEDPAVLEDDDDVVYLGEVIQREQPLAQNTNVIPQDRGHSAGDVARAPAARADVPPQDVPPLHRAIVRAIEDNVDEIRDILMHHHNVQDNRRLTKVENSSIDSYRMTKKKLVRDTTCAICLDDFAAGRLISTLPCKHEFHAGCIKNWLKRATTCPNCRQSVV